MNTPLTPQNSDSSPPVETTEWAVDVVARAILYDGAHTAEWANYPEIGEHDWERIVDRLDMLAALPDRFLEAYDLLEKRAEVSDG